MRAQRYDAVLFDLLTALLDSWSLWSGIAGDPQLGRRWRDESARLIAATGDYRPYAEIVAEAGGALGIDAQLTGTLLARWNALAPWPEAPAVVAEVARAARIGVVTNCSEDLGRRAADRVGVPFDVVVTAEAAGAYKPRPEPYRLALERLGVPSERALFVAGSRRDVLGATALGMPVWWHNRIAADAGEEHATLGEGRSLNSLLAIVGDAHRSSEAAAGGGC